MVTRNHNEDWKLPPSPQGIITPDTLRKICATMSVKLSKEIASLINVIFPKFGIIDTSLIQCFIATLAEESREFTIKKENLNYSAVRLMQVWPTRFKTLAEAQQYEYQPKKIAERVYGKRNELGNITASDGWLFIGGGFIQLTGRLVYSLYTAYYNDTHNTEYTIMEMAELVRTDNYMALQSACWYVAYHKPKLLALGTSSDFRGFTFVVNGGYTNYSSRFTYYELCKKHIYDK